METAPDTKKILNSLAGFFYDYQDLMYQVFTTSTNMANEINKLKKTLFDEYFVRYHEEIMENIEYLIEYIKTTYKPKYFLAVCDFIDLVYQNAFYDIFATKLQELEIVNPDKIKEPHLYIFNLIVHVEHVKYNLYVQTEMINSQTSNNPAVGKTLEKRKANSLLRIGVCTNLLEPYSQITNQEFNYMNIIKKYGVFEKNMTYHEKFFKDIN
jgi:hypothetical protein